jgi:hypothetical protein
LSEVKDDGDGIILFTILCLLYYTDMYWVVSFWVEGENVEYFGVDEDLYFFSRGGHGWIDRY